MKLHVNYKKIFPSDRLANYSELKYLLNIEKFELDRKIKIALPLTHTETTIDIKGSYDLLETFKKIDDVKYDYIHKLEDVKYLGLNSDDEIILEFSNEDENDDVIQATGIYNFTYDFFKDFEMASYANFCIENNLRGLIDYNATKLLKAFNERERQFRILEYKNERRLRGLTSTAYNNYDNNIIIYIFLYKFHYLNKTLNNKFFISQVYITDSAMKIMIQQEKPERIAGVGNVYYNLLISNNEIRSGKVLFESRYTIQDEDNKSLEFNYIEPMDEAFISFEHHYSSDKALKKLDTLSDVEETKQSMINLIRGLKKAPVLSPNIAHSLFQKIHYSRRKELSKTTKDTAKKLINDDILQNTYSLIKGLNIVTNLAKDIDEKIALERIYYDVIQDILKATD